MNNIKNFDILPTVVLDRNDEIPLSINYSSSALGITERSSFYESKMGYEITVRGCRIDGLIETKNTLWLAK